MSGEAPKGFIERLLQEARPLVGWLEALPTWLRWGVPAIVAAWIVWPSLTHFWDEHVPHGLAQDRARIAVASPAIYSRERLLNDRFEQAAWLENRLRETDRPLTPRDAPTVLQAGPGAAPAGPPAGGGAALGRSDIRTTTSGDPQRNAFNAMNGFRDQLRAERARELLDDSHDIDGNTLYLLAFDTTVAVRPGARGYAAVEAYVTRHPDELRPDLRGRAEAVQRLRDLELQDLFDIYLQWLRRMRSNAEVSVQTVTQALLAVSPDPALIPSMLAAACAEVIRHRWNNPGTPPVLLDRQAACRRSVASGFTAYDQLHSPRVTGALGAAAELARQEISAHLRDAERRKSAQVAINIMRSAALDLLKQIQKSGPLRDLTQDEINHVANFPRTAFRDQNPIECQAIEGFQSGQIRDFLRLNGIGLRIINAIRQRPAEQHLQVELEALRAIERNDLLPCWQASLLPVEEAQILFELALGENPYNYESAVQVTTSCIAASFIQSRLIRPQPGENNSYSSLGSAFFDVSVRRAQDLSCALRIDPTLREIDAFPNTEFLLDSPARAIVRSNGHELTIASVISPPRIWRHGTWHTVSSQNPLRLGVQFAPAANEAPAEVWLDLIEVRTALGHAHIRGRTPEPVTSSLIFREPIPKRFLDRIRDTDVRFRVDRGDDSPGRLAISPPDRPPGHGAAAEGQAWIRVDRISPFQHLAQGQVIHEVSSEARLAVRVGEGQSALLAFVQRAIPAARPDPARPDPGGWILVEWHARTEGLPGRGLKLPCLPDCLVAIHPRASRLLALQTQLEGPGYTERGPRAMTRATPYALTPRLRDSVSRDQRTDLSIQGSYGQFDIGGLRQRAGRRDASEQLVIGFSRAVSTTAWPQANVRRQSGARFGWMAMPQADPDGWAWIDPVQQFQLGAIVSVPSWWRSALVQVCSRFSAGSRGPQVLMQSFWDGAADCHVEILRLPGTANDVSRRLGVEVITYPYVNNPNPPPAATPPSGAPGQHPSGPSAGNPGQQGPSGVAGWRNDTPVVEAEEPGRPSEILIRGERLWRSTVVTLGSQRADLITVLPDMSGIIATFNCVERPTTWRRLSHYHPTGPFPPDGAGGGTTSSNAPPDANSAGQGASVEEATGKRITPAAPGAAGPRQQTLNAPAKEPPRWLYTVPLGVWTSEGSATDLEAWVIARATHDAGRGRCERHRSR